MTVSYHCVYLSMYSVNVKVFILCPFLLGLSSRVISCAFVSNLNESSAAPSLQPDHPSMKAVLEGDLVMNVFRDGCWGVFRHQRINLGTRISTCILIPVRLIWS